MANTTLSLALEGERLCKLGDFKSGVAFFEAAIQSGTDDLKTLSAIYSQLGNAYFFLGEYNKAVLYHRNDLTLARTMADKLGEAKASGNLGNTLKLMGKFDEAILCCRRHLDLTTQLDDKVGKARALYNLANAYHAKGKHVGKLGQQDPGEFPSPVHSLLSQAQTYYTENLALISSDPSHAHDAGRTLGNLGNVHYLMGNFPEAIKYHEMRLEIAQESQDLNAQRRAYTNLGNAHVFSGNFELAAEKYKNSLAMSIAMGDKCVEAQACYSLGNTYTLLRNYPLAIEYHLRHLNIAMELDDKVGEGRAFWSLGNAHSAMGECREALEYARGHLRVSMEIGDEGGEATARMNVTDLKRVLNLEEGEEEVAIATPKKPENSRRKSMQELQLIKMTPDAKLTNRSYSIASFSGNCSEEEADSFFDMLTKVQGSRIDEQRCEMPKLVSHGSVNLKNKVNKQPTRANSLPVASTSSKGLKEDKDSADLMNLIWGLQGQRMDEQRCEINRDEEDEFFDMLVKCQSSRLEDQRSVLPTETPQRGLTVPDEDFFNIIVRFQGNRLNEQRAVVKDKNRNYE